MLLSLNDYLMASTSAKTLTALATDSLKYMLPFLLWGHHFIMSLRIADMYKRITKKEHF